MPVFTYNGMDKHLGGQTFGGYSESITVDEAYTLKVSPKLDLAATAPLLCAGITTYSPLRHWKAGPERRWGSSGWADWAIWA
jgi:alcohol dehydrogenase (NADP+)